MSSSARTRPDERRELVGVAGGDRLEVEVDAVGAAGADGRRDLLARGSSRAVGLPSSCSWRSAAARPGETHTVSTTRVPFVWAALMIEVIRELVQPPQPVVGDAVGVELQEVAVVSEPTLK